VAGPNTPASEPQSARYRRIDHFVMNLPDSAIEFLINFRGILDPLYFEPDFGTVYSEMPMVHCHCFTRELKLDSAVEDISKRISLSLGCVPSEDVSYHYVRTVAPKKDMYCVSFRLPRAVALSAS